MYREFRASKESQRKRRSEEYKNNGPKQTREEGRAQLKLGDNAPHRPHVLAR
jgi:hypothetical protein